MLLKRGWGIGLGLGLLWCLTAPAGSASIKEILCVLPMRDGSFYVLHFSAEAALFGDYFPVFERVVASFKTRSR